MKLNSKQLRKIILEVAKQRLKEEGGSVDVSSQVADFVSEAFTEWLHHEGVGLITNNAWKRITGTLGYEEFRANHEEFVSPGHIKNAEHLAESAADKVLSDPSLRQKIVKVCRLVLESSKEWYSVDD